MKEKKNNWWLLEAAMEFAKQSPLWAFVWWIVIIIMALQISWLSIWTVTDKWFWLEEKKIDQSYELQLKTFEFLQWDVMSKLDDIYKRMDNVEADTKQNKEDINRLEDRIERIENEH